MYLASRAGTFGALASGISPTAAIAVPTGFPASTCLTRSTTAAGVRRPPTVCPRMAGTESRPLRETTPSVVAAFQQRFQSTHSTPTAKRAVSALARSIAFSVSQVALPSIRRQTSQLPMLMSAVPARTSAASSTPSRSVSRENALSPRRRSSRVRHAVAVAVASELARRLELLRQRAPPVLRGRAVLLGVDEPADLLDGRRAHARSEAGLRDDADDHRDHQQHAHVLGRGLTARSAQAFSHARTLRRGARAARGRRPQLGLGPAQDRWGG